LTMRKWVCAWYMTFRFGERSRKTTNRTLRTPLATSPLGDSCVSSNRGSELLHDIWLYVIRRTLCPTSDHPVEYSLNAIRRLQRSGEKSCNQHSSSCSTPHPPKLAETCYDLVAQACPQPIQSHCLRPSIASKRASSEAPKK
jgi:hypothetical protein